jgi:hypothetical protein
MNQHIPDNEIPSEILRFQMNRQISLLFKSFLILTARLADEHDIALDKLEEHLPDEYRKYVSLADYLSDEKREMVRKEILDAGNDTIRFLERELAKYEIKFK